MVLPTHRPKPTKRENAAKTAHSFCVREYGVSIRCGLFLMEYEMDLMSARCQRTLWSAKDSGARCAKRTGNPFIDAGADGQLNEPYNAMH